MTISKNQLVYMESYQSLINFLQTTIDELGMEYFKLSDRDRETDDHILYDLDRDSFEMIAVVLKWSWKRPGYGTPKPVDVNVNIFVNSFGAISAQELFINFLNFLFLNFFQSMRNAWVGWISIFSKIFTDNGLQNKYFLTSKMDW